MAAVLAAGMVACRPTQLPATTPAPQAAASAAQAHSARPQRIVSLNLCTDQLLLQLVDKRRIVGLSRLVRNVESSMLAQEAQGIPVVSGSAEEVLALKPDLVLAGAFTTRHTTQMLRQFGIPVLVVPGIDSLEEAQAQIMLVARHTGDEARGRAIVRRMQLARQHLADAVAAEYAAATASAPASAPGQRPAAALYGATAGSAGSQTLYDDMLNLAGWRNAAAEAGIQGYGTLPLEQLVAAAPRLLLVPHYGYNMQGAQRPLEHPVLTKLNVHRLTLPARMTICGGPWNVQAAELLAAQRRALALPHNRATPASTRPPNQPERPQ